jgi:hypothetical protein
MGSSDTTELKDVLALARPDVLDSVAVASVQMSSPPTWASTRLGTTGFTQEQHAQMKKAIEEE